MFSAAFNASNDWRALSTARGRYAYRWWEITALRGQADFRRRLHLARDGLEAEVVETALTETIVAEVMAELAALEDPKAREVNEKHGDDHGVNLSKLRAFAKQLKTQQELARQLWETDDTAARLLAILICRPKAFEHDELDVMVREARTPPFAPIWITEMVR
jgi:hypothetical protein